MFNFSSFFGGFGSGGSGGMFGINFSDYRMIKSGSYLKMMRSYYADQKGAKTSKSGDSERSSIIAKLAEERINANRVDTKDSTGLSKMKNQADSLKTAAESFDNSDVFQQEDGEYDMDKIVKNVNDFAGKYNNTIDQSRNVASKEVAEQVGYMQNMTKTMSKALEKVGITVGIDGKLSVDEEKLKSADIKDVKALFSGRHSFAGDIANKAAAIGSAVLRSSSVYSNNGSIYNSLSSSKYNMWI